MSYRLLPLVPVLVALFSLAFSFISAAGPCPPGEYGC